MLTTSFTCVLYCLPHLLLMYQLFIHPSLAHHHLCYVDVYCLCVFYFIKAAFLCCFLVMGLLFLLEYLTDEKYHQYKMKNKKEVHILFILTRLSNTSFFASMCKSNKNLGNEIPTPMIKLKSCMKCSTVGSNYYQ